MHKDYPQLVKDSLVLALEQRVTNNVLDYDTYTTIKDETFPLEEFQEYLLTKPNFMKTDEEIFEEFEILRGIVDAKLSEFEIKDGLVTESLIDKDVILVTKKFCINEAFTMDYFKVEEKT